MKQALFYEKLDLMKVRCLLCPHRCTILHDQTGKCGARKNLMGDLYSLVYGLPCTTAIDPIEKKPLYHFLPKSRTFSIATPGCNLRCTFCQNWQISQASHAKNAEGKTHHPKGNFISPEQVVNTAKKAGCKSISFTYVEPSIFYEYMLDIAKLAKKEGLKTIMVTNGYINPTPARALFKYIDAVNIDIKGFTEKYYKEMCHGSLKPVLKTIKLAKKMDLWIELTTLVIPTMNDDEKTLKKQCAWIKKELGPNTPVHFSRFFPYYKMTHLPQTPLETMQKTYDIAKKSGIKYVYLGNIPLESKPKNKSTQPRLDNIGTFCWKCKKKIIYRNAHYNTTSMNIKKDKCGHCGASIAGVF